MSEQQGGVKKYEFYVAIDGMTCKSCEVVLERKAKKIEGVVSVDSDSHRGLIRVLYESAVPPSLEAFKSTLQDAKYTVAGFLKPHKAAEYKKKKKETRPSWGRVMIAFGIALLIGFIFQKLGLIKTTVSLDNVSVGAAFVVGLVAAISSCAATVGGLLVSATVRFQEQYASESFKARLIPVALFIFGRLLSYTALGAFIGLIGSAFSPSSTFTGAIIILAALYMIVAGLDMLGIMPASLKRFMPSMPKGLSHRFMEAGLEKGMKFSSPFLVGFGTFFVPCGFTQAFQIYALTTGSALTSGLVLGAFALGTVPVLSMIGLSVSAFARSAKKAWFYQVAGALVLLMGFLNVSNGFALMGVQLDGVANVFKTGDKNTQASLVPLENGVQVLKMTASGGYSPNHFTVRAGVPVKWVIDATQSYGCESAFQVPKLGIKKILQGVTTLDVTFPQKGSYPFSCSMGMFRGVVEVVS